MRHCRGQELNGQGNGHVHPHPSHFVVPLYRTNLHVVLFINSTPNFNPEIDGYVIINLVEKENNGNCFVSRAKLNSKFLVKKTTIS